MAAAGPREEHPCATPGPEPPPVHAAEINRRVFFRHRGLLTWPLTGLRAGPAIGREHEGPLAVDGLDPACCEPEAATWRATAPGPGRAQRPGERTRACRERAGRPAAGRIIPAGPPAQRLPGEPDELIGTGRQCRRARPGPPDRSGDRELSHFLAVAIHRELAPLAAGTKRGGRSRRCRRRARRRRRSRRSQGPLLQPAGPGIPHTRTCRSPGWSSFRPLPP